MSTLAILALSSPPAVADQPPPGREIWAGVDVSTNVWLVYSGVTLAPFGGIHDDGLRFRAAGGYGEYTYTDKVPGADPAFSRGIQFHAQTYYADFLIGYLKRWGDLTAKGFVGASIISHDISPFDTETVAIGDEVGVKGVIELWLNIGERGWGQLDLAWSSAHNTRTARAPRVSRMAQAVSWVGDRHQCRLARRMPHEPVERDRVQDRLQRGRGPG